jgi:hypothetical protein
MSPQYEQARIVELGSAGTLVLGLGGFVPENPEQTSFMTPYEAAEAVDLGVADERVLGFSGTVADNPDIGGERLASEHD